ncbi:MAG: autotransporter outer membrane beta-barrel domain-containing protein [Candidatus Accumulibacter sp.]|nr:autotransporter outer membrane beta-barrel domain-containing protein [Accumulibacter sp.]
MLTHLSVADTVTVAAGVNTVTLTNSTTINPSGSGNILLQGNGSAVDVSALYNLARANKNTSGYFAVGDEFQTLVNGAVNASSSTLITMSGSARTNTAIEDLRGGFNVSYDNWRFSGFIRSSSAHLWSGGVVAAVRTLAVGDAVVGTISNSIFSGNKITVSSTTNYVTGSAVVAAVNDRSTGNAVIEAISSSIFSGNTFTVGNAIYGGGVVATFDNGNNSTVGAITSSIFSGNTVTVGNTIYGGGVVAAYSGYDHATVGAVTSSIFSGNTVTVGDTIYGGGVVAAYSGYGGGGGSAFVRDITSSIFSGNRVTITRGKLYGGIVVGVFDSSNSSVSVSVGDISDSVFSGNKGTTGTYLCGGGVLGAASNSSNGVSIGDTSDSVFSGNEVTTGSFLEGGGIIGLRTTNGATTLGGITGTLFNALDVTAGTYIRGGGVIGLVPTAADAPATTADGIKNSRFTGNTITANNGQILGGIFYSYGLDGGMSIEDSEFRDNTFTSSVTGGYSPGTQPDAKVYGLVTVDTAAPAAAGDASGHMLTLSATSGKETVFSGNKIIEAGVQRFNSLYFGPTPTITTSGATPTSTDRDAQSNAVLNIEANFSGTVALYDPIRVEQNNSKTFDMHVNKNVASVGNFIWGGTNTIDTGAATGAITLYAGKTTLLDGFELTAPNHSVTVNDTATLYIAGTSTLNVPSVAVDSGGTLEMAVGSTLTAGGSALGVASGATMTISGNNSMNVNTATLSGTMRFIVGNVSPNNVSDPMLKLTAYNSTAAPNAANISGSTVTLTPLAGNSTIPLPGDCYYLIEGRGTTVLDGIPANATFSLQQGALLLHTLDFDILKINGDNDNKTLIAQLRSTETSEESKAINEGGSSAPALIRQGADLLANGGVLAATDSARTGPGQHWFGIINGGTSRYHTGSRVDTNSVSALVGRAVGGETSPGYLTLGGFIEHGAGSYDTHNSFPTGRVIGSGRARYTGGGVLARLDFNDAGPGHVYTEFTARAGKAHTDFHSGDLRDAATGKTVSFHSAAPYWGAHANVGYLWNIDDKYTLDVYGKYLWTHYRSDSTTLSTGERVNFKSTDSRRARGGARLSYRLEDARFSVYAGAAWEREFDGTVRSSTNGASLPSVRFTGDTGIGEIGLTYANAAKRKEKPNAAHMSVDFGVQNHTGKRDGTSGTLRVQWDF